MICFPAKKEEKAQVEIYTRIRIGTNADTSMWETEPRSEGNRLQRMLHIIHLPLFPSFLFEEKNLL